MAERASDGERARTQAGQPSKGQDEEEKESKKKKQKQGLGSAQPDGRK